MPDDNGRHLKWEVENLIKRVERLEQHEPAVMKETLKNMADDVSSLKKAFYTFAFSVVGSVLLYALIQLASRAGGTP